MEYRRLNFLQFPEFKPGRNITVRLGDKWNRQVGLGDKLLMYQTDDPEDEEPIATGTVISSSYKPFMDITTSELKDEHNPYCRTAEGLAWTMLEAYPDKFNLNSYVTVLAFTIDPEPEEGAGG